MFERRKDVGHPDEPMLSVFREHGVVLKSSMDNLNVTAENRNIYQLIDDGWLAVNRMKAWQGSVGISTQRGIVSGHYICFRPVHAESPRYLNWLLRSSTYTDAYRLLSRGVRPGQAEIDNDYLRTLPIVLPPIDEQRRIADFLDDQVARIDAVVRARIQQRDLVDSIIEAAAHAGVTGQGIEGRRPSALAWCGSLPEGWGEPRICQVATMGTGHTPSRSEPAYWENCHIPWLTTGDVHRFRHDEIDSISDSVLHISQLGLANSAAVVHPKGTVALSRTASAGFSIVMDADMATSQDFATWTPGPRLDSGFLLWCLRAMRREIMGRLATGSTHKTIYFPELMSIRIPLPTLDEQRAIVRTIQDSVESARSASAALGESIELLQEIKRSLISAAVSGEFDVSTADGSGVRV